jgi:hypothetical protein
MIDFLNSGLGRLLVGVILAGLLYVWRNYRNADFDLLGEAKRLVLPAVAIGAGAVFMGVGYLDAATTTLTALGVALGLNSRGSK